MTADQVHELFWILTGFVVLLVFVSYVAGYRDGRGNAQ